MKNIKLTMDKIAIVDEEDYPLLSRFKWYAAYDKKRNRWEAKRRLNLKINGKRKQKLITMHKIIIQGMGQIDHINHNTLDNRKINLRKCSSFDNQKNRLGANRNSSIDLLGVSYDTMNTNWIAQIMSNKKNYWLGRFPTAKLAAITRDKAAGFLHKEYASFNYPELQIWSVI